MRASSIVINDVPNINCEDTTVDDHSISFEKSDLRIPFQLNGVFSCFSTRAPAERELYECEKLLLTPNSRNWNPHFQSYERNE